MDEQLLRIRIAALDAAVAMVSGGGRSLVNNDAFVTDAAEHFETWLTRPTPVDAIMDKAMAAHAAETTADRIGYPRCPTGWKNTANLREPHVCMYPPGHAPPHRCACGSECDMP